MTGNMELVTLLNVVVVENAWILMNIKTKVISNTEILMMKEVTKSFIVRPIRSID